MDSSSSFKVSPAERGFYEQNKCFDLCVKSFKDSMLTKQEKKCVKSCLAKLEGAEKMYLQKLKETMEQLVLLDPTLRNKFQQNQPNHIK